MPVDLDAARRFMAHNARLLDRRRFDYLFGDGSPGAVVDALRPYANADGGFGQCLEPDLRAPISQPSATIYALEILTEAGAPDHDLATGARAWLASIAARGGGLPFVVGDISAWPHGPWWVPTDDSFLTSAAAAVLHEGKISGDTWLDAATEWTWERIASTPCLPDDPGNAYSWKYFVWFLDRVPDRERAAATLAEVRDDLADVIGRDPDNRAEQLTPLDFTPDPALDSSRLYDPALVERFVDRLEASQADDGGFWFDWLQWSPGATLDWRGAVTVRDLKVLKAYGRC